MLTKEQMDALRGVAKFDPFPGYDTNGEMYEVEDGEWVWGKDYDSLAATVIEQQSEIERLRQIIAIMDSVTPKADDTCDEPGIVLSVAVQRRYPHLSKGAAQ